MHETVAWVGSGSSIKPHEALQPIIRCSTAKSNLSTMPAKVLAISIQPCDVNIGCVFRPKEIYTLTGYFALMKPMTTAYLNVDVYLSDYKPTRTWLPFPGSKPINLCAMGSILKDAKCPVAVGAQADFRVPVSFTKK